MVKKNVLSFFGILLLMAGVLFFIQFKEFGGLSGYSTYEPEVKEDTRGMLVLHDVTAFRDGSSVQVSYVLSTQYTQTQEIDIAYALDDREGMVKEGRESIIVEPGEARAYALRILVPSGSHGPFSVRLSAYDESVFSYQTVDVKEQTSFLTSRAISDVDIAPTSFGLFFVAAFIFGYAVWYVLQRRKRAMLAQNLEGRFVRLRDLHLP